MCGIFGYWDRSHRALDDASLRAMAGALVHRGPDDEGIWHQPARGVSVTAVAHTAVGKAHFYRVHTYKDE